MTDQPTEVEARVLTNLKESGYPLELKVAKACLDAGAEVEQGWHYLDLETGKLRESDVAAVFEVMAEPGWSNVVLTIECKTGNHDWVGFLEHEHNAIRYPWVQLDRLFTRETGPSPRLVDEDGQEAPTILDALSMHLDLDRVGSFLDYGPMAYGLVQAKRPGESNQDRAYKAVTAAMSAAQGWLNEDPENQFATFSIVVPVVVVDFPLLHGWLDDSGEIQVRETAMTNVAMRVSEERTRKRCVVTTLDGLPKVLEMATATAKLIVEAMTVGPMDWADRYDPSVDGRPDEPFTGEDV